jgi:hypothetical protein
VRPPQKTICEAEDSSEFFLSRKLADDTLLKEMTDVTLSDENIRDFIRSRDELSACGNDGTSYRIVKPRQLQRGQFVKHMINAIIQSRRVLRTWKEARPRLIYKKGDRKDPKNWRSIIITKSLYRIYTCLMARAFQQMKLQYRIYPDAQKDFNKKKNGCSEDAIILNELFNDARRKSKDLIVTAIGFTNAFRSASHESIMPI